MLNPGLLDRMLTALYAAINPAWSVLINDALWLLGVMSTLYLIGMCMVVMSGGLDGIPQLYVSIAKYMGFVWMITNARTLATTLVNVHGGMGLIFSGSKMTAAEFALPGRILWQGQDMLWPLISYIDQLSWLDYALNAFQIQFMTVAMWVSWIGFALFAMHMFYTQVQVWIAMLANIPKLSFGIFGATAFLAKDALASILSQLFRLMTVSLFVGVSTPWFQWLAFPANEKPGYWSAFAFMGGVWMILILSWAGPRALEAHGGALVTTVAGWAYGMVRGVSWLRR